MQTVYPGERKLKKRLMRQMWKEMFINLIKKWRQTTKTLKAFRSGLSQEYTKRIYRYGYTLHFYR